MVLYCVIISGLMMVIARSFVPTAETKNQTEAEFRAALTRVREYGESIAILGGEKEERAGLDKLLSKVIVTWAKMAGQYMRTMFVSHGNFVIASVIPVILCAPKYLAGEMTLGTVMQAAAAFIQVQYAFNWIVDNYPRLAEWTASARRASNLLVAIDGARSTSRTARSARSAAAKATGAAIRLQGRVGRAVATAPWWWTMPTSRCSSARRCWSRANPAPARARWCARSRGCGRGAKARSRSSAGAKMFLMPQKPYIPLGTLRRATTYPRSREGLRRQGDRRGARSWSASSISSRSSTTRRRKWDRTLSGGEQQRLAFARLFLHEPDIVVMDEATSALDPESQAMLMEKLGERLPKTAIISVGHRPELEAFHERKVNLVRREGGAKLVPGEVVAPPISILSSTDEALARAAGGFARDADRDRLRGVASAAQGSLNSLELMLPRARRARTHVRRSRYRLRLGSSVAAAISRARPARRRRANARSGREIAHLLLARGEDFLGKRRRKPGEIDVRPPLSFIAHPSRCATGRDASACARCRIRAPSFRRGGRFRARQAFRRARR